MVVVSAFGVLAGTENAGMTAYYRAPDCDSVDMAGILPLLSKINHYEDEYVIGEMLIWDVGSQSEEPNNCDMVRIIVYNDGWICAWFDKTTTNQLGIGGAQYVSSTILEGWGTSLEYENRWNGCQLKITGSTDPDCPVDTIFTIRNTDHVNGQITVHNKTSGEEHFNSGYSYGADIYMTNGNLLWVGAIVTTTENLPPYKSNRLYRALYQLWEVLRDRSNSTHLEQINASRVYRHDYSTNVYSDETTDFNDEGTNDVATWTSYEGVNDAFYIGSSYMFSGVWIHLYHYAVGSDMVWEYYNGLNWVTLPCVDGTSKFTANGTVSFSPPIDWIKSAVNSYEHYWIRARVIEAAYTTPPTITQGQLNVQASMEYTDAELGLYDFEFTGANYVLMCGKYYSHSTHSYFYFTVLPTHTIYDSVLNVESYGHNNSYDEMVCNGITLFDSRQSKGHVLINLSPIAYPSGTQNVVRLHCDDYRSGIIAAAILTVS